MDIQFNLLDIKIENENSDGIIQLTPKIGVKMKFPDYDIAEEFKKESGIDVRGDALALQRLDVVAGGIAHLVGGLAVERVEHGARVVGARDRHDADISAPQPGAQRDVQHRASGLAHVGPAVAEDDVVDEEVAGRHRDVAPGPFEVRVLPHRRPTGVPAEFVQHVIPELQRRGLMHKDYAGKTLRENLGLARPDANSWKKWHHG